MQLGSSTRVVVTKLRGHAGKLIERMPRGNRRKGHDSVLGYSLANYGILSLPYFSLSLSGDDFVVLKDVG